MSERAPQVAPQEALASVDAGECVLVDVRDASAYEEGHAPGALNLPLGELQQRLHELPQGVRVVTTCGGGTRGPRAAELLREAGRDAAVLQGGMRGWRAAGLPVEPS